MTRALPGAPHRAASGVHPMESRMCRAVQGSIRPAREHYGNFSAIKVTFSH